MSEVHTSTMKPANGASAKPEEEAKPAPKKRRRRKAKSKPAPPTPERLQTLGQMVLDARRMDMSLEEYVDWCREVAATYDALVAG